MIKNLTVGGMIQNVAALSNEVVSSTMFNDQFWVNILNFAMSYIYSYHNWSWDVYREKVNVSGSNVVELVYGAKQIISVKYNGTEYKQSGYYSDENTFIVDGNRLVFSDTVIFNGDVEVVYRKWFKPYTINDKGKQLDIPFQYENILNSLMLSKILPIWLGEGSGGVMNNYIQDAIQQLEIYKRIDTYSEVERDLEPNNY